MYRNRFLALAAVVTAVGLVAGPADASRKDSWAGNPFMPHFTDIIGYPHRAVEHQNMGSLVYIPDNTTAVRGYGYNTNPIMGVATFGKDNYSLIVAANDNRGYNGTKTIGGHDNMPGSFLDNNIFGAPQTFGLAGGNPGPSTMMQIGGAYGTDSANLGAFLTIGSGKWTSESSSPGNPTVESGTETSYIGVTLSAGFPTVDAFESLEASVSFSTGSQETLGEVDTGAGEGNNSSFAGNILGTLDSDVFGFMPSFNATFGTCSADYMPNVSANAVEGEWTHTGFRVDVGGTREWSNGNRVAVYMGARTGTIELTSNADNRTDSEDKELVFPVCGVSSTVKVKSWFSLDMGAYSGFYSYEDTNTNIAGGSTTSESVGKDTNLQTNLLFGPVFHLSKGDFKLDVSMTVDPSELTNPGGTIFGGDGDRETVMFVGADAAW